MLDTDPEVSSSGTSKVSLSHSLSLFHLSPLLHFMSVYIVTHQVRDTPCKFM